MNANSRRKWILFIALTVTAGAVSLFFHRAAANRTTGPAPEVGTASAAPNNPAHELAALAAELEKKPDHSPVLLRMAQLERETGQFDRAVEHLQAAVKADPANLESRLELGRALYEKGDVPQAIEETAVILKTDPRNADALYNLGAIYANSGDSAKARSYWQTAVDSAPASDSGGKARDGLRKLGGL